MRGITWRNSSASRDSTQLHHNLQTYAAVVNHEKRAAAFRDSVAPGKQSRLICDERCRNWTPKTSMPTAPSPSRLRTAALRRHCLPAAPRVLPHRANGAGKEVLRGRVDAVRAPRPPVAPLILAGSLGAVTKMGQGVTLSLLIAPSLCSCPRCRSSHRPSTGPACRPGSGGAPPGCCRRSPATPKA